MDESFERRSLLDRDVLRALVERSNSQSALRLTLHVGGFLLGAGAIVAFSHQPWIALPLCLALGAISAAFFAPFHECIHQTAFRSRRANRAAAWIAAIPFCMAPSVYRAFHWEHHRHTQDPSRDPEIKLDPVAYSAWPRSLAQWLGLWGGTLFLRLKTIPTFLLALSPARGEGIAPWTTADERPRQVWESRVIAAGWVALGGAALLGVRGAGWILLGMATCHIFHGIWLPAEHRGLPHEGSIFARTRTMHPSRFVQWWLWNMNYHAEHHAWPAIPWHQLPEAHRLVANSVEQQGSSYWRLHVHAFRKRAVA